MMSADKLVDSTQLDSDLTSVANAIRAKSGGSSQLAFPQGFVDAVEAIETGAQTTPYIILTGTVTPASDSNRITISANGITTLILAEGHVENHESYLSDEYENMALGFYVPNGKAIVPTNYAASNAIFIVYMANANDRSYFSSGVTASFANGSFTLSNTRNIVFKAGIPVRYIIVGV